MSVGGSVNLKTRHSSHLKSIYPGALSGWIMDSFDLSMMFLLVPTLAEVFFPSNYGLALIGVWSIYTTTFVFRPVGGLLFGRLGDKIGRKRAMIITLTGLGIIIFATGFLPTYAAIGIAAPILLFIFRIITGIFGGGEYGNSASIIMESVRNSKRGFWSGAIQSGYPIGYTLAAVLFLGLNFYFGHAIFFVSGWRWMFYIGIIPVIIGLIIRLKMPESALWSDIYKKSKVSRAPIREVFRNAIMRRGVLEGVLAMTGIAWVYGLTLGFFPTILSINNFIAFPTFLYIVIAAILTSLVGYFISGAASDRIGRRNTMIAFSLAAMLFSVPFAYMTMNHMGGVYSIGIFAAVIAFFTTGIYGVIPAFLSEKFPTKTRSTGVGIGFNGGFILGNWSTVFLLLLTTTTAAAFFGWWAYFIVIGEVFILVAAVISKETKGIDLTEMK
jgi:MFS family permease